MPRTDIPIDAMLRHLGAAYYESLHGRASRADVARALYTVEEGLGEAGLAVRIVPCTPIGRPGRPRDGPGPPCPWLVAPGQRRHDDDGVDRITPYKEVARVLAEHRISGLPVLKMGHEVGVVTEADLLREQAGAAGRLRSSARRSWRLGGSPHPALTAGELRTATT